MRPLKFITVAVTAGYCQGRRASSSYSAAFVATSSLLLTSTTTTTTTTTTTGHFAKAQAVAPSERSVSNDTSNQSSFNTSAGHRRGSYYYNTSSSSSTTCDATAAAGMEDDPEYPGTAVARLHAVRERVKGLSVEDLNGPWEEVRRKILWAGGLRDLPDAVPGRGYTGHSFNDFNHVDLTTMKDGVSDNENDGQVKGIVIGNRLGQGIRIASLPELGPGGSWSTCAMGCNQDPPQDVAHVQFRSRIAFKMVWVPNEHYDTFVLVDDDGKLLARGTPLDGPGGLPSLRERKQNYRIVQGSKYAEAADAIAFERASTE